MPYIDVRGVPHAYQWITAAPRIQTSPKPVLVFVHGWGGSRRYWQQTATSLTQYFDCLLYDLRGFGQSCPFPLNRSQSVQIDTNGAYALETYAEDLVALLNALDLQKVYLNAHSMGASIAALFLNQYPDRVVQAILTCSGLLEYDELAFSQFHRFGHYVVKFRPRWLMKIPFMDQAFMARFLCRPIPKSMRKAFLEDFIIADHGAALGTMLEAVSKKAATEMPQLFKNISVPTLVISGEQDQIITAEMGKQAASLNAKVDYIVIPRTAHFPMLEDAKSYLAHVSEFLQLPEQIIPAVV